MQKSKGCRKFTGGGCAVARAEFGCRGWSSTAGHAFIRTRFSRGVGFSKRSDNLPKWQIQSEMSDLSLYAFTNKSLDLNMCESLNSQTICCETLGLSSESMAEPLPSTMHMRRLT